MPYVGIYPCASLGGPVPIAGYESEDISRPGIDGHEFRILGMRGRATQISAWFSYSSALNRANGRIALKALQSSVVLVVDNDGITWNNIRIASVQFGQEHNFPASTSSNRYWQQVHFEMQPVSTYY